MLDTYVDSRLRLWAAYCAKREDGGLGYPRKSNFVREVTGGFWTPDMDLQCVEMDRCVSALEPMRKEAVLAYYEVGVKYRGLYKKQKAAKMGCCENTYDNRLTMAKRDILGYLNDVAAGVPLPDRSVQTSAQPKNILRAIA